MGCLAWSRSGIAVPRKSSALIVLSSIWTRRRPLASHRREAALRMRKIPRDEGLSTWPKLTGGKGIHMAPFRKPIQHDEAHRYALRLVRRLAEDDPQRAISLVRRETRCGRIFLDYLRNGRGSIGIGTYSPRVRVGFPIAARCPGHVSRPASRPMPLR
jgi:DNA primase